MANRVRLVAVALAVTTAMGPPVLASDETLRVSPGDPVTVEGSVCALGFLLEGNDGADYMTTAGHCVFPDGGTRAWSRGDGPVVSSVQGRVGRVVFAENVPSADGDDEYDFAILRLDADVEAQPYIRGVGVPSGLNDERSALPTRLRTPTPSRSGRGVGANGQMLARTMDRPEFVYAYGAPVSGAVGGPVVDDDGRAVGTLLGTDDGTYDYGPDPEQASREGAPVRIGRLAPVLVHAGYATRLRYRLVVGASAG